MDEPEIEDEPKRFDAAYIRSLKAECARYRLALRDKKAEAADLEVQLEALQSGPSVEVLEARESLARFERELADLEDEQKKTAIMSTASEMGVIDPASAYRLLDESQVSDPQNVKNALIDLVRENPYLVEHGPPPPTPGVGGPPLKPPKPTATELFAQMLRNGVRGARGGRG